MRDWEEYKGQQNKRIAELRAKNSAASRNGEKCPDCGLYGCVCQTDLKIYCQEREQNE